MRIAQWFVALVFWSAAAAAAAAPEPQSEEQKILYAVGLAISRNLIPFHLSKADLEMVQAGLADGVLDKKHKVDLPTYGPRIQELQRTRLTAAVEHGKKAGKDYVDRTAAQKGTVKTASGMLFVPLKAGAGAAPKATDTVKVHYHGTSVDGKVFDSSVQRGEPATFALNEVVPCWTEGLQLMKVGAKAKLVCPPNLAYGERGAPPAILPEATLVFEVELLDIIVKQ